MLSVFSVIIDFGIGKDKKEGLEEMDLRFGGEKGNMSVFGYFCYDYRNENEEGEIEEIVEEEYNVWMYGS